MIIHQEQIEAPGVSGYGKAASLTQSSTSKPFARSASIGSQNFNARRPRAFEEHASFNADYIRRLQEGDSETQRHFTRYFGRLLTIKVQNRMRSPQLREEVRQETFLRVLIMVRRNGVEHPERLGALVNSICENVLQEAFRKENRTSAMSEFVPEPIDGRAGPESAILLRQRGSQVRGILDRLPTKDRQLLEQIFLEERSRDEVCRTLHISREYLRVMLHRAKARFRYTFQMALIS